LRLGKNRRSYKRGKGYDGENNFHSSISLLLGSPLPPNNKTDLEPSIFPE